ncbi:MAG: hypothetical protein MI862_25495, partial [Desulfobacterales bacterium]|nr:hypothetical protein [Desulfobacterales bacterium]
MLRCFHDPIVIGVFFEFDLSNTKGDARRVAEVGILIEDLDEELIDLLLPHTVGPPQIGMIDLQRLMQRIFTVGAKGMSLPELENLRG